MGALAGALFDDQPLITILVEKNRHRWIRLKLYGAQKIGLGCDILRAGVNVCAVIDGVSLYDRPIRRCARSKTCFDFRRFRRALSVRCSSSCRTPDLA